MINSRKRLPLLLIVISIASLVTLVLLIKLSASRIKAAYDWHTFYGGNFSDYGSDVAVDERNGSIYILGSSNAPWVGPNGQSPITRFSGKYDIFILKLTPSGEYIWHTFYGGTETDYSSSLALDADGNVYITGTSTSWNGLAHTQHQPIHAHSEGNYNNDILVLKLSPNGAYQWHTFFGNSGFDASSDIIIDSTGNISVVGSSDETWDGSKDQSPIQPFTAKKSMFLLKLSTSGTYIWHTFFNTVSGNLNYFDIEQDVDANLYITGVSYMSWDGPNGQSPINPHHEDRNGFMIKLTDDGDYVWHTFFGGIGEVHGTTLVFDRQSDESLYVCGISSANWFGPDGQTPRGTFTNDYNSFVLSLNLDGEYQWHTFISTTHARAIAFGQSNDLYIAGISTATKFGPKNQMPLSAQADGSNSDISITSISTEGVYQWHTYFGGTSSDTSVGLAYDVDDNGNQILIITGQSYDTWEGPERQSPLNAWQTPKYDYQQWPDMVVLKLKLQ